MIESRVYSASALTNPSSFSLSNHELSSVNLNTVRNRSSGLGFLPLVLVILGIATAFFAAIYTFGIVVPPGKMGIRQAYFDTYIGPKQGFSLTSLKPGYHGNIPFLATIHILPTTWIPVHFNREAGGTKNSVGNPPLKVKTKDGVPVDIDATIMIRLFTENKFSVDGKSLIHGGPSNLLLDVGMSPDEWYRNIVAATNKHLGEALKRLNADDFYDYKLRSQMVKRGETALRETLAKTGIEVGHVLLRRFSYEDEQIEESIFKKNLQQVEYVLGVTNRKLAEELNITAKEIADLDRQIEVLKKNADVKSQAIREQAKAELVKAEAEGEAMVMLARAEIDEKRAKLLANTRGADIYVARQLAPVLGTLKGGLISGLDPYDLEGWIKRLGVDSSQPNLKQDIPEQQ
jgi:regulator of protease activity HflC (stomatin/prohibitin superfamily)